MDAVTRVCLGLVGVIHLVPAIGVSGTARLHSLYGVAVNGPDLEILLRHRAVLLGIVGAILLAGAVWTALRDLALAVGMVSVIAFLMVAASVGQYNALLQKVVWMDVLALILLLAAASVRLSGAVRSGRT
jgi:hypothetical protein